MSDTFHRLSQIVTRACAMEVLSKKPGNVHPEASFSDCDVHDFLDAAYIIGPILSRTAEVGIGKSILLAVEATQKAMGKNVNLGIILLLAPLCACGDRLDAWEVQKALEATTIKDAEYVYEAIRIAKPGGLGKSEAQDVSNAPSITLLEAMKLAAERDDIAKEYATNFRNVFHFADWLKNQSEELPNSIVTISLKLMADGGDTLIARKRGEAESAICQSKATAVLKTGWPSSTVSKQLFREFDTWLRAVGHQRNPGTTADLVAAILFVYLQNKSRELPH